MSACQSWQMRSLHWCHYCMHDPHFDRLVSAVCSLLTVQQFCICLVTSGCSCWQNVNWGKWGDYAWFNVVQVVLSPWTLRCILLRGRNACVIWPYSVRCKILPQLTLATLAHDTGCLLHIYTCFLYRLAAKQCIETHVPKLKSKIHCWWVFLVFWQISTIRLQVCHYCHVLRRSPRQADILT